MHALTSIQEDPFIPYAIDKYREVVQRPEFKEFKSKRKQRKKANLYATKDKQEYRRYMEAIDMALNEN